MNLKKFILIKRLMILSLFFCNFTYASQAKMESDNLIISSIPEEGMMVSNGELRYLKKYKVSILNAGSSPVNLKEGCYYASDYSGNKRIKPKIFSPQLNSIATTGSEGRSLVGTIEFISVNDEVYSTTYVGWDRKCK